MRVRLLLLLRTRVRGALRALPRIALAALIGFLLVGSCGWTIYDARQAAWRQAVQQESNIALGIEGEIRRSVASLDVLLQAAVRGMATPGLPSMPADIRHAILFSATATVEGSGGVVITDEAGRIIYDSMSPIPRQINIFDRTYFQTLRAKPDLGLVIGPPVQSRFDGKWVITLARRINHPDGSFAGVAARGMSLELLQALFDALDLGHDGVVNLLNTDGLLVARRPMREQDYGRDLSGSEMFRRIAKAPAGEFEAKATIDGVRRLYSYRQVEHLPLIVGVGFPVHEIYAGWLKNTLILCGVLSLLLLIALFSARNVSRSLAGARLAAADTSQHLAEIIAERTALFAHSVDMIVVHRVTSAGDFVYESVNPVWEGIFAIPAAGAIGQNPRACLPAQHAELVIAALEKCITDRRPVRLTFDSHRQDETRSWEGMVMPVISEDGKIRRLIGVARNMTERNMLEAGLRQSQRMEAVGQLTAGVAHDFNNMLQGILGALDLLGDQLGLDSDGRTCVAVATDAAQRGATLVHRLLAFSRKQPLDPVLLSPESVVSDISQLLDRTLGGHIRLETKIDNPPWPVCADLSQLQNCLFNLAINARDAMPSGGVIRLRIGSASDEMVTRAGLPGSDYTYFMVEDEGQGMSPETVERALEPFFTTKEVGKGTGLGLPMVQGFARQSGGDVRIETDLGRGTTVTLWLPRANEITVATDEKSTDPLQTGDQTSLRVLVVDDEPAVRQTLSLFLTKAGYAVDLAGDAKIALNRIASGECYDLLIADQSMPGLTGSEMIGKVALLQPALPSILITGFDKVGGLGELQGRVTVLRKPFTRTAFLQQVAALIGGDGATAKTTRPGINFGATRPTNIVPLRAGSAN